MSDHNDPIATFVASIQNPDWTSPFPALEELCQQLVGHRLFSCSVFNVGEKGVNVAARVYTSDETSYPTSGLKEIAPNRWTKIVIDRHETFIANSVEGFSDVFPDHEFIASLGLGSVVNLPVILKGRFIGTVNMLHEAGYYTGERTANLKKLLLPAIISYQLADQFGK